MQSVIETPSFLADAKDTGIDEAERMAIVAAIAADPLAGDEIRGSGGARKLRFAGRGKGKSGGYRIITYFGGDDIPVFLLNVFAKGDRVNLGKAEVNGLKAVLAGIARAYREGARHNVEGRRTHPEGSP
jgi:hypothetical protein